LPLSDRDYMRRTPRPARRSWGLRGFRLSSLNPVWLLIIVNFVLYLVTIAWGRGILDIGGFRYAIYKMHYYLGLIPAIVEQRPWTMLTNMFVHAEFWHIFMNMLFLYFFGSSLIRITGTKKFLLVYFLGGIVGNIFTLAVSWSSVIPVVGASAAVYSLAGTLVVLVPNARVALWGILPMPFWAFIGIFFVLLALPPFVDISVAWQAHLGGLITGLVAGYIFRKSGRYYYYYR
jgi:membrane associated rhomboid family serine protease